MPVIPDHPFPEMGHAFTVDVSADGEWIAASSYIGARAVRSQVGIYRTADLSLWHLVELDQSIEGLAFHPALPLLAIATEEGDESYRRGELVLYEPGTRRRTAVPFDEVGVTALHWIDERRLEIAVAEPDHAYERDGSDAYLTCVAERDDWRGCLDDAAAGGLAFGPRTPVDDDGPSAWDPVPPRPPLADLADRAGRTWNRRDEVVAVEALTDGRVIAALRCGTLLECWSAEGELLWSVPEPDDFPHRSGGQLYVTPDEETAWVTVLVGTSDDRSTLLRRIALTDGTQLAEHRLDFPVAITARADGAWVARDSRDLFPPARWPPYESRVYTPSGKQLATLELGECDRSFDFRVRRSPHLLFLYGAEEKNQEENSEKWVVEATPKGIEPLFPLLEDAAPDDYVMGGPAVYVHDSLGPGLVHSVLVNRRNARLLRRALPHGDIVWTCPTDARVTGVDTHEGLVHVVTGGQELLTLRADDGKVIHRGTTTDEDTYGPYAFTPCSLTVAPNGDLLIGTAEGRILVRRSGGLD
ncbi:hypothetical protein [Streptomyces sp. NBC_00203]|uniref:hypothetical protein n=1 Tax=Streptomyces sp. NBC_00203 TaxID=2975680 RepID=UPI00324C93F3